MTRAETMSETPDERLIEAVVNEMQDCFEQYALSNIHYMLAELLEDGVDKRRVLADFVRHGLYPNDE